MLLLVQNCVFISSGIIKYLLPIISFSSDHFLMIPISLLGKIHYVLCFFALMFTVLAACVQPSYDLVIKGGTIYDGSGRPGKLSDIAIHDDEIVLIAGNISCKGCQIIDVAGLAVSPGFIDLHAHLEALPIIPDAASALNQGVTTALGGPDGSSPIHLGRYLDTLEHMTTGINVAYLIGHNSIRAQVMGMADRKPATDELRQMKQLVITGMEDGAFGISTGLKYLPGAFSDIDEVVTLSEAASEMGGIYTSHLREEGLELISGVAEAIHIADRAHIPVVLTHHKVVGHPMWGSSIRTLAMVDSARTAGLDISIDQYPYTASFTSLSILIPSWAMEGGRYDAFARRCEDPVLRDSIKRGIVFNIINDRGSNDLGRVQLAKFDWKPHLEGQTLKAWALEEGLDPTSENGAELVIQAQLHRGASAIFHAMADEDVDRIMQHPVTMIASDGRLTDFGNGFPHPRAYGTFPRVLGHYVREKNLLSLETAIAKMTSMPAKRLGLSDRGLIKKGYKADLVIFDPTTIIDKSDFTEPHQYPIGIHYVMVNGSMAVAHGVLSTTRYGRVLRGPAYVLKSGVDK